MNGPRRPHPIRAGDVRSILTDACPGLAQAFAKADWYVEKGEPRLMYVEVSEAARAIGGLLKAGRTACFRALFAEVERCLRDGDDDAVNLIVVGLLEGLQNGGLTGFDDFRVWETYLGPTSARAWRAVSEFRKVTSTP